MEAIKNKYKDLLRICISVALLLFLFSKADLETVADTFLQLSFVSWMLGVLFFIALCTMAASRWFIISTSLGFTGTWFTYVGYYFIGQFFNLFLPTSIGGDVFKIHYISRGRPKKMMGTYSVMADRFFGLAAMLLMGGFSVLIGPADMLPAQFRWVLYLAAIGVLALFCFMPLGHGLVKKIKPQFGDKLEALLIIWKHPLTFSKIIGLSVALNCILVSILILLATNLGLDLHPTYYFAIFPLTAAVTILPVSFNGIGLREGAFIFFLSLQDVTLNLALTLSLSLFAIQCSGGIVGGIAYSFGLHKKRLPSALEKYIPDEQ